MSATSWQSGLKRAWIRWARAASSCTLAAARSALFRRAIPPDFAVRRIVVFRIGNIGDILVGLPALDAIRARFAGAHITLLTSPGHRGAAGAAEILPSGRWFDDLAVYYTAEIRAWTGRLRLLRRVRQGGFDLFVELPNQQSRLRDEIRNMIFARLAGCRYGAGFEVSQQARFLREQSFHFEQIRESRRIHRAVAADLGLAPYREVALPVPADKRREAATLLRAHGIGGSDRYAVIHPGAKRQTNRWPAERWACVADSIVRSGTRVILTGSAADLPLAAEIARMMTEEPVVLCGEVELAAMPALLERAVLYAGADTGPMHIAAAVGTPVVSVFSARDFPERWYPAGDGHTVFRADAPCSPCFKETCDRDRICINAIETCSVLGAVEEKLRAGDLRIAAGARP